MKRDLKNVTQKIIEKTGGEVRKNLGRFFLVQLLDIILVALFFLAVIHMLPWTPFYCYAAVYICIHLYKEFVKIKNMINERKNNGQ